MISKMQRSRATYIFAIICVLFMLCVSFMTNLREKDGLFHESFLTGDHLYRFRTGRDIFWNGEILYLGEVFYNYNNKVYEPIGIPDEIKEVVYDDNETPKYRTFSQYEQQIIWIMPDGSVIIFNPTTKEIRIIETGFSYLNSPTIKDGRLFFYENGLFQLNLDSGEVVEIPTNHLPYHNIVMNENDDIFFQSPEYYRNGGEQCVLQNDVIIHLKTEKQSVLNKYIIGIRNHISEIDACDETSMYYTVFSGNYYLYESRNGNRSTIGSAIVISDSDFPDRLFTSEYDKYLYRDYLIATLNKKNMIKVDNQSAEIKYYVYNIPDEKTCEIELTCKATEEEVYHCFDSGVLYFFLKDSKDNSIRIIDCNVE